ncbi:MAG: hypothetical protein J0I54_20635 [Bosea sp.]|uniref:hypothetical protein n=1 Tax=unclassified Bosea (in: a-proteobacteria) TaxID=2653178 RepID=UPI000A68F31D|nr:MULTISPECIES: hypothetical protein [unclassified Bosea (in: a-proteobacteria)]MBN9459047.1 hypothetical protein [Bosea sp. (in: a-proteobacteria)]
MCRCADRRAATAAGARAVLRGDLSEAARQVKAVTASARLDLEMARAAAAARLARR